MELDSLKEILLKKAEGNNNLLTFVKYMDPNLLLQEVVEALEKMAEPTSALGRGANSALISYGANLDNSDVHQLRDALGHHVSHYKAALKAHHAAPEGPEKKQLREVADKHLNHLVPLMHLAGRAGAHSNGKMALDYTPLPAWESNYTTTHRVEKTGKLKHDTEKLGRRPSAGADRKRNIRAVPDYHYLEMPPHPGHPDSAKMPHKSGYPFEEVQLGSPTDIDAKKAYLNVEDVPGKKEYAPHPFDNHPIYATPERGTRIADTQESFLTPEKKEQFANDLAGWKGSDHHKQWLADQKAKFQANPEAYKKRGSAKPSHHYEGIPLQEQPDHVREGAPAEAATTPAQVAPAASGAPQEAEPEQTEDQKYQDFLKAPPAIQKMLRKYPEYAKLLADREGK